MFEKSARRCNRRHKQMTFSDIFFLGFLSVSYLGYTCFNLLDSPELFQILVTLTAVIKPVLPNLIGRAIVILNFVRRFRIFIADTVPW